MKKKYYEVVVEGHYKAIWGLIEGFILGSGKKWDYYFSKKVGVKTETLGEIILEWITLKTKLHYVIMEDDFCKKFEKAMNKIEDSEFVDKKYIKSVRLITDASLKFEAVTYGRKYGNEIKDIFGNLPEGIELQNYDPVEKFSDEAKGVELYAPAHDYAFKATGTLSGDVKGLIEFREKLDEHPLIEVEHILLQLEEEK